MIQRRRSWIAGCLAVIALTLVAATACSAPEKAQSQLDAILEESGATSVLRIRVADDQVSATVATEDGPSSWTATGRNRVEPDFQTAIQVFAGKPPIPLARLLEDAPCDDPTLTVSWLPGNRQITQYQCGQTIQTMIQGNSMEELDVTTPTGLDAALKEIDDIGEGAPFSNFGITSQQSPIGRIGATFQDSDVTDAWGDSCAGWVYLRYHDGSRAFADCLQDENQLAAFEVEKIDSETVVAILDRIADERGIAKQEAEWNITADPETECLVLTLARQGQQPATPYEIADACPSSE